MAERRACPICGLKLSRSNLIAHVSSVRCMMRAFDPRTGKARFFDKKRGPLALDAACRLRAALIPEVRRA